MAGKGWKSRYSMERGDPVHWVSGPRDAVESFSRADWELAGFDYDRMVADGVRVIDEDNADHYRRGGRR